MKKKLDTSSKIGRIIFQMKDISVRMKPEVRAIVHALHPRSCIVVPLAADGPTLGALLLGYFSYYAIEGERGLLAYLSLTQELRKAILGAGGQPAGGHRRNGDEDDDLDEDDEFDDEEDDEFRPKKGPGPRRDWE